jgi:hypothetical protein
MHRAGSVNRRLAPVVAAFCVGLAALPTPVRAAELRDGTPVFVRLVGVINSEITTSGQPLRFVVTRNVVDDRGGVLIRRGTVVAGVVRQSRRPRWGFTTRKPRLVFTFTVTTARDGQVVMLREAAARETDPTDRGIVVDRYERHHQVRWASGADVFQAYVDGTYEM